MADQKIIFGNVDSSEYGIYISGEGVFDAPKRDVEQVRIPGRNGTLEIDRGRFENIEVTYPAFNYEATLAEFSDRLSDFRNALCSKIGYQRLTDTIHTDEYRMATFRSGLEVSPIKYNTGSTFDIVFDCKPQRYLKSGDKPHTFTSNGYITNPTLFDALPIIAVTGNGRINVAGHLITVSDTTRTIYIDSELMEVYIPGHDPEYLTEENSLVITDELWLPIEVQNGNRDAINMNAHVAFADYEFPTIGPGEQPIAFDSTIESVVVYPRWWRL